MKYKHYNGDFKKFYDISLKRHYWLLGYFGGGSINVVSAYEVAQDYAKGHCVSLDLVKFDIITDSRFAKRFKYCYSQAPQEWDGESIQIKSFHKFVGR